MCGALSRVVPIALCLAALPRVAAGAQAPGGTIERRVVDDRTGRPLAGVVVRIESQSSEVETDRDGGFTLTVEGGGHVLQAALIGYALNRREIAIEPGARLAIVIRLAEGRAPTGKSSRSLRRGKRYLRMRLSPRCCTAGS